MNNLRNLNNFHLKDEQIKSIKDALTELETALEPIDVNLTPAERKEYGSINEKNKLLVNKVHDYAISEPALRNDAEEWEEFFKDYNSRGLYESLINRLERLLNKLINAKTLHDYDNYQAALDDYQYTMFRAKSNVEGFEHKFDELSQFFRKYSKKKPKNAQNPENKQEK